VNITYSLVVQFVYVIPLMGLVQLWMFLDGWSSSSGPGIVSIISTLIAMQGLFMLYRGTYPVIHHYHPTFKFVTIKSIVLVSIIQARIIQAIVDRLNAAVGVYDSNALAHLWTVFFLAIESPVFGLMMVYAFPVDELMMHEGEQSKEEVELDTDGKPKKTNSGKRSSASVKVEKAQVPNRAGNTAVAVRDDFEG